MTMQCQPLWQTTSGGGDFAAPAVAGGRVYVGSLGGVIDAFDAAGVQNCRGTPRICPRLGKAAIGAEIESAPAVDGAGVVYFGTDDGVLYAVDGPALTTTCDRCAVLWHSTPEASTVVRSSPAIANGVVYVNIGGLHAFAPGAPR